MVDLTGTSGLLLLGGALLFLWMLTQDATGQTGQAQQATPPADSPAQRPPTVLFIGPQGRTLARDGDGQAGHGTTTDGDTASNDGRSGGTGGSGGGGRQTDKRGPPQITRRQVEDLATGRKKIKKTVPRDKVIGTQKARKSFKDKDLGAVGEIIKDATPDEVTVGQIDKAQKTAEAFGFL